MLTNMMIVRDRLFEPLDLELKPLTLITGCMHNNLDRLLHICGLAGMADTVTVVTNSGHRDDEVVFEVEKVGEDLVRKWSRGTDGQNTLHCVTHRIATPLLRLYTMRQAWDWQLGMFDAECPPSRGTNLISNVDEGMDEVQCLRIGTALAGHVADGNQVIATYYSVNILMGARLAMSRGRLDPSKVLLLHVTGALRDKAMVTPVSFDHDGKLTAWPPGLHDAQDDALSELLFRIPPAERIK